MKTKLSRRSFVENLTLATSGIALLSSTSFLNAFNSKTDVLEGYNPYAGTNPDMRQGIFENYIKVTGTVYSKETEQPISGALVEVWHLSPNSKKYRHRAKLKTDANGQYSFLTDPPNKEKGQMPAIHFKLSTVNDSYCSRLWIHKNTAFISSEHWARNQGLGDRLLPKKEIHTFHETITFNLSI
ncbi:MAG: hypothetical protein HKN09_10010 [Saprospiraceae bacterium]|nr:hypothetical protein [Saprospiraceae bacterium]